VVELDEELAVEVEPVQAKSISEEETGVAVKLVGIETIVEVPVPVPPKVAAETITEFCELSPKLSKAETI
jgi:hypothetical protein